MLDCHRSLRNTAASYGPERPEAVRHFLRALIERSLSARGAVLTHGLPKSEMDIHNSSPPLRSAGGPKLLKWGPPRARVKSAKVRTTPYVYYPPAAAARGGGRQPNHVARAGTRGAPARGARGGRKRVMRTSLRGISASG